MSNPSAMKYGGYEDDENHRVGNDMEYFNSFPSVRPSRTYNPYLQNDSSTFFDHQPTLAQLTSFVYQLSATVGSLSHENSILLQTTRQLLVDNEGLKRQVEQSDLAIKEISRASLPGGHWVWEAGYRGEERVGRWVWSGHKYKQIVPQPADGLPAASLESMPVELFNEIASLLPRSALLALCGVSTRLLELTSSIIYPKSGIVLGAREAVLFVNARTATPCSNQIRSHLLPVILKLSAKVFNWGQLFPSLEQAPTLGPPLTTIPISSLHINPTDNFSLLMWAPILAHLNPKEFLYRHGKYGTTVVPSTVRVEEDHLWFLPSWTRLERFLGIGTSSIPVTPDGAFAFLEALDRGRGEGKNVEMSLIWRFKEIDRGRERMLIGASEIVTYLSKTKVVKSRLPADHVGIFFDAAAL